MRGRVYHDLGKVCVQLLVTEGCLVVNLAVLNNLGNGCGVRAVHVVHQSAVCVAHCSVGFTGVVGVGVGGGHGLLSGLPGRRMLRLAVRGRLVGERGLCTFQLVFALAVGFRRRFGGGGVVHQSLVAGLLLCQQQREAVCDLRCVRIVGLLECVELVLYEGADRGAAGKGQCIENNRGCEVCGVHWRCGRVHVVVQGLLETFGLVFERQQEHHVRDLALHGSIVPDRAGRGRRFAVGKPLEFNVSQHKVWDDRAVFVPVCHAAKLDLPNSCHCKREGLVEGADDFPPHLVAVNFLWLVEGFASTLLAKHFEDAQGFIRVRAVHLCRDETCGSTRGGHSSNRVGGDGVLGDFGKHDAVRVEEVDGQVHLHPRAVGAGCARGIQCGGALHGGDDALRVRVWHGVAA